eukprot:TRINITY_DN46806_c0_g1_i1.p1 TRINITY_DN46806_c0_g1~~TRINITY_DN46806_c0_g1_i1.p1  ORF type:complete len:415 (+),score=92.66 TRINITY_DN46806_c0_g1_i1:67-1311(+)
MRLLKEVMCDDEGVVKLKPEDDEDLWHLYNLVLAGDTVRTSTLRKVQKEGTSSSVKMRLTLTIRVKSVEYDPDVGLLRFSGQNVSESEHVKMGAHHTMEVGKDQVLSVGKRCWDDVFMRRIREACDPDLRADLAAVVMQEGVAHVCLLTGSMTVLKQKVEQVIPRKRRAGATQHDKAILRFFDTVLQAVTKHVNWDIVKCLLICTPGFLGKQFIEHSIAESIKRDSQKEYKDVVLNKGKFVFTTCSSGYLGSLKEVLASPEVAPRLANTKAADHLRLQEECLKLMREDEDRVTYGRLPVFAAAGESVIRKLLILDSRFRPRAVEERRKWVKLVEDVEGDSGEVHIFSSMHETGEWLKSIGGIAAILTCACPHLAELDSDDEEEPDAEEVARRAEADARVAAAEGFAEGDEGAFC